MDGQEPDRIGEAIEVHGVELITHDQRLLVSITTEGRWLVSRAPVLVKAMIQVLRLNHSGCKTTANRRPLCSWPFPLAGNR